MSDGLLRADLERADPLPFLVRLSPGGPEDEFAGRHDLHGIFGPAGAQHPLVGRSRELAGFAARHQLFHVSPAYTNDAGFSALAPGQDAVVTGMGLAFIDLVALLMGVNSGTVWKVPQSGSQTDFESFRRLAQTAERGLFAAFFLGEGLRLREHLGRVHELDVAGRPDGQTMLAALAAVTSRIGLVATQNTTYNDPVDLAHRLASLDLISDGRAGWNVVTTDNACGSQQPRRAQPRQHLGVRAEGGTPHRWSRPPPKPSASRPRATVPGQGRYSISSALPTSRA